MERLERRLLMASIAGAKYHDLNFNGTQDGSEPGLPGWIVYADTGTAGSYDGTAVSSSDIPKTVPDLATITSTLTVSGFSGTISDVNVTVNISHLWDSDVDAHLISPMGTRVELMTDVGSFGDDFNNLTLDDDAAASITTGSAPFQGYWQPEGLLSALDGQDPNGLWTLEVTDDALGFGGTLDSWSVQLNSTELSTTTDKNGNYVLTGLAAGTHDVREIPKPVWVVTEPASGVHTVELIDSGSTVTGKNFGAYLPPGDITGRVYSDNNGNGVFDTGEPTLSGWTVYLDANNNGVHDGGELSRVTDAQGDYAFDDLTPQQYVVRTVLPAGYVQTSPTSGGTILIGGGRGGDGGPANGPGGDDRGRRFTNTEIVANITGRRALADLADYIRTHPNTPVRNLFDLSRSRQLFRLDRNSTTITELRLRPGVDPENAVKLLADLPFVKWASVNTVYDGDPREFTPDDPSYPNQYHHPLMQNNLAWDTTLGSAPVLIAITDDGTDFNHQDLAAGIWNNSDEIAGNSIDDDNNGYVDDVRGWDFWQNDNDMSPLSVDNHGTHVAGIAGARTNNTVGVSGTAGGATILPIRFWGTTGNIWTSTIVAAAYAYAANNGAKILSTSYNVDGFVNDPIFLAGLQYVYDNGVLHFNSAGNNTTLNPPRQSLGHSFYVANTNQNDEKHSTSNWGFGIDLTAPGVFILSTTQNNGYNFSTGTSMATPNAAAVAALIWSAQPTWTREQVAAQLIGTTDNIDAVNPDFAGLLGSGRVNSFRAVTQTLAPPKFKPGSLIGLPAEGATVNAAPTAFSIDVANVLNPATANNAANWSLKGDGLDNTFGTADDTTVSLVLNTTYLIATNRLSFTVSGAGSMTPDTYRFTASSALADPFGAALDGNGDGTGGDAFTRTFTFVPGAGSYQVGLEPSETVSNVDFGNFPTAYTGSTFVLRMDPTGEDLQVWVDQLVTSPPTYTIDRQLVMSLAFTGGAGDDMLTVDYSNGHTLPNSGVTFTSGAGDDTLSILGRSGADTITFNATAVDFAGAINHSGNVERITLDGAGGADAVLVNAGPTVTFPLAVQSYASITVASAGKAQLTPGGSRMLIAGSLSLQGTLDLHDNDLILDYTGASELSAVQAMINSARNGGAWDGVSGLLSSAAKDNALVSTTLGALESAEYLTLYPGGTFSGQTLDPTMVLVKYTYYGDSDFNGLVDGDDYARIDLGFNTSSSGWLNGDFDGNGFIDGDDYALIDAAFNLQGAPL
jgi:subtilisin family serine protease